MDKNYIQYIYDEPVVFEGVNFYPARMREYYPFFYSVQCLLVDKNSIPDSEVISMNYLDFLYHKNDDENNYIMKLKYLIFIITKMDDKNIDIKYDGKKVFLIIDGKKIDGRMFEKLKNIILEQNEIEKIDDSIHPELRKKMEEAKSYRSKTNGVKIAGLEDQMICVSVSTGLRMEDIYLMTIRKFTKTIERIDHKLHYEIYLSASMGGMVEFKNKDLIKHWMADLKKEQYSDIKIDYEKMKDKIEGKN